MPFTLLYLFINGGVRAIGFFYSTQDPKILKQSFEPPQKATTSLRMNSEVIYLKGSRQCKRLLQPKGFATVHVK